METSTYLDLPKGMEIHKEGLGIPFKTPTGRCCLYARYDMLFIESQAVVLEVRSEINCNTHVCTLHCKRGFQGFYSVLVMWFICTCISSIIAVASNAIKERYRCIENEPPVAMSGLARSCQQPIGLTVQVAFTLSAMLKATGLGPRNG